MEFITLKEELGTWDVNAIIDDIATIFHKFDFNWYEWKGNCKVIQNGVVLSNFMNDLNLTSNPELCPTTYDRMFKYAKRYHSEGYIEHNQLTTIIPEIHGTYVESMIIKMQELLQSPIRVRLHNRTAQLGLYWHVDKNSDDRYHMPLWTNPGHFLVWTDEFTKWDEGFDPNECKTPMKYNAEFIPADGKIRLLATRDIMHGVASIGVGYNQPRSEQSRCHLTFWKV